MLGRLESGLCQLLTAALGRTHLALAKFAEVIKAVNAGRVPVTPMDLQRVAAYQFRAFGPEGFCTKDKKRAGGGLAGCSVVLSGSVRTGSARALIPQVAIRINAQVPVRPFDREGIVAGRKFDLRRLDLYIC